MHPYFASRLAVERQEEFRRQAEMCRLFREVSRTEPHWRTFLEAGLYGVARRLRPPPRSGRPTRWPTGNPVAKGLR